MTMADTIAVMNAGVIEQMGNPADLYENPTTTFVANFLGQSNLIGGTVNGASGSDLVVDVNGSKVGAVASRSKVTSGEVWVGVRPEKVSLHAVGAAPSGNVLSGGVVSDVSFVGVSTQYLVRMPWEQELMVFEQNSGSGAGVSVGDSVDLGWAPEHTFLLDARQDANAGAELEDAR